MKNFIPNLFRDFKKTLKQIQHDKSKIVPLSFCLILTACGFQPLYTSDEGCSDICYPLKVATIPDRNGQILRNHLIDLLTPEGAPPRPPYVLEIKLVEEISSIGVKKTETTSRKKAILRGTIILRDSKTQKVVYTHSTEAINSFSVINQNYYSDLIAEEYAKREAIRLLAEKIKLIVSAYFNQLYEN